MKDTIAITGSAGYIGSVMCQYYRDQGYRVIDVDRNYRDIHVGDSFVDDFSSNTHWFDEVFKTNQNGSLIGIVHLAAEDLIGPSYTDPGKYYENNVSKSQKLIDTLLFDLGVRAPFIFASSAAVYGLNNATHPAPINTYGKSKYHFEQILEDYASAYQFRSTALRFFNVVGGYGDLGQPIDQPHVLTSLFRASRSNKAFIVQGNKYPTPDGTVIRDYVHVIDICDAILYRMKTMNHDTRAFRAYDLGTGRGTSVLELFNTFKILLARGLDIDFTEARQNDPERLIAKVDGVPKHSTTNNILYSAFYAYEAMAAKHNSRN